MVKENLGIINEKIRLACLRVGRVPSSIKIVAATKDATPEMIKETYDAGIKDVGENRVKEAILKKRELPLSDLTWHFIGHLQSNKAKDAVREFSLIHSIDSLNLLQEVNSEAEKINKVQDVLIEVNVSDEDTKFGISPDGVEDFLDGAGIYKNIKVLGFMTMAPTVENPEHVRGFFRKLKELADKNNLKELSMGMTQDFEVAIEEGATMIRLGRALFKGFEVE